MKKIITRSFVGLLTITCILSACNDDENFPSYTIPDTYNFQNVNYSGQTTRLDMMAEITAYMKTGNEGAVLNAQRLKDMYANANNAFENETLNTASKDLKSKTFAPDQTKIEEYMDALALASQSAGQTGSNGKAGLVTSKNGDKTYLLAANGYDYPQIIEKSLMGACFYYQANAVYMSDEKIGPSVDNTAITEGEGTDMEHHWDEAFGYLGVPADFPANTETVRFWGKYCAGRDALLGTNQIMDAFIKGRAAISAKDMETKNKMVIKIRETWEKIATGTAIHYINTAINNFDDAAIKNHALSESWAFVLSLKYNPKRKITPEQIEEIHQLLGDNFYEVTVENLTAAKEKLAGWYDMENVKNDL